MGSLRKLVFCALAAASACTSSMGVDGIGIAKGQNVVRYPVATRHAADPIEGESLRPGARVTTSPYAGQVLVVNFWASWCGPCRKEQPILETLSKSYAAKGVAFIGVSERDQKAAAIAYLDEFGVTYPSIYDPYAAVSDRIHVRVMPQTFVIDKLGKVAATIIGALRAESDLTTILDEELAS